MKQIIILILISVLFIGCKKKKALDELANNPENSQTTQVDNRKLPSNFNEYWYQGTAEITSYQLAQERYGAIRNGKAVTIFVTEPFNPSLQVKADNASEASTPVLKLNFTKNFYTGIYPYSIMTSSFLPVKTQEHALKITHSIQEWCGQAFMQLNNKKKFDISSYSYFESESDETITLEKSWLEDELFSIIRLNPKDLPQGEINIIPSFEYIRMRHKEMKPLKAFGTLKMGDDVTTYELSYTNEKRALKIFFNTNFPFNINGWEETHANGLSTKATAIKTINTPYWQQNGSQFESLRDTLQIN